MNIVVLSSSSNKIYTSINIDPKFIPLKIIHHAVVALVVLVAALLVLVVVVVVLLLLVLVVYFIITIVQLYFIHFVCLFVLNYI